MPYPNRPGFSNKKGAKHTDQDQVRGLTLDPGPHIATVMSNQDSNRRGAISVWTEILGDPRDNPNTWIEVQYASPFISQNKILDSQRGEKSYDRSIQSSGMWVPTPDIGTQVLITFPGGNRNQGIWFACVPYRWNNRNIPGLASSSNFDTKTDPLGLMKKANGKYDSVLPVGEYVEQQRQKSTYYDTKTNIEGQPKPINLELALTYKLQGLNDDIIRGHTTSSSQRETPSDVFGINTKGRRKGLDTTGVQSLVQKLLSNADLTPLEKAYLDGKFRSHGHSFVMDDGDIKGDNELIRLRSSSGHQILMHDTQGVIYIGNSTGTTWMEFGREGTIDVYSQGTVNMRTREFNFHADSNMNFYAGGSINMLANGSIKLDNRGSGGINLKDATTVNLDAKSEINIKSGGTLRASGSGQIDINAGANINIDGSCVNLGIPSGNAQGANGINIVALPDTLPDSKGFWNSQDNKLKTIVSRAPTHEPFTSRSAILTTEDIVVSDQPEVVEEYVEPAGPAQAKSTPMAKEDKVTKGQNLIQPDPSLSVSDFTTDEMKNLIASIAQAESRNGTVGETDGNTRNKSFNTENWAGIYPKGTRITRYQNVNQIRFVGKYQFGLAALEDTGYIRSGTFANGGRNNTLLDPNVWSGKGGVNSLQEFLETPDAQEQAMEALISQNFGTLQRIGVIDGSTPKEVIGGYLAASHLLGPGTVKKWAFSGGTFQDANGTTADKYFNIGRNAILTA
jgi:hypothetical protein